ETADLVRAVVRAVARADAAIVGHVVQPLAAVHGGVDGAHHLAGRVLALHAGDRLVEDLRRVEVAAIVAIDADPLHLPTLRHRILPHRPAGVLRDAGGHAGVASDARPEVDRHAPRVPRVLLVRVERQRPRRGLAHLLGELRIRTVLVQRRATDERAAVHRLMILGAREQHARAGLQDREARSAVERVARADRAGIEADVVADPAEVRPAEA